MNNLYLEKKKNRLVLEIFALSTYEDFDILAKYLQKYFVAEILESVDGPDARIWEFKIKNQDFKLENNPYGNTLYCSILAEDVMNDIYSDLTIRLKN